MRVFVSEYLCGGAWDDGQIPESLLREGRSMLTAIAADFAGIENCRVVTTYDRRLGTFPTPVIRVGRHPIEAVEIHSPRDERAAFRRLAAGCDATCVIAPEFDGILAERCRLVVECGGKLLGSTPAAIDLCADKFALAEHLEQHDIPTIPTQAFSEMELSESISYPAVIKPRDGAGSLDVFLARDAADAVRIRQNVTSTSPRRTTIVQPYVEGRPLSVSAIVSSPECIDVFPAGLQCLSVDGRFQYLGGQIPAPSVDEQSAVNVICSACETIPGLRGYVGFDMIQTQSSPQRLLIVEINPRLTTSYLGYRALTDDNLAARMVFPDRPRAAINWKRQSLSFTPDGGVQIFQ